MSVRRFLLLFLLLNGTVKAADYMVDPGGSDAGDGSISNPWKTIQHALDEAGAGGTVRVRGGVYSNRVVFPQGDLSLTAYGSEVPVIDGSGLTVASGWDALVDLNGQSGIVFDGFELCNFSTATRDHVPIGLLVRGGSKNIELSNLRIHDIETGYAGQTGGDAHGLAVYGDSAGASVSNLLINSVEIYDCLLGSSESMVINGNVEVFVVSNCRIHDNNNIGIDFIGHEGTCSDAALDQARDGVCADNTVSNIVTIGNPAYGGDRSADGIYVDGGTRIVIERNIVHDCDIGIEIASEHSGKSTLHITVRNNWIYRNYTGGLFIGGYDSNRGSAEWCTVAGNTFWENDTGRAYNGEIYLQMYVQDCRFVNNVVVPLANDGGDAVFVGGIGGSGSAPSGTVFDHNLYWSAVSDPDHHLWTWGRNEYYAFDDWQVIGQDVSAMYQMDPLLTKPGSGNLHLGDGSPAVDSGTNCAACGDVDLDGQLRAMDGAVDIGADEVNPVAPGGTEVVWLERYGFGDGRYGDAEQADVDGDGRTAWQEYLAGTDPLDGDSFFRVISLGPGGFLEWIGGTNGASAPFMIWRSTNLSAGGWVQAGECARTGAVSASWTDVSPPVNGPAFYKITVFGE